MKERIICNRNNRSESIILIYILLLTYSLTSCNTLKGTFICNPNVSQYKERIKIRSNGTFVWVWDKRTEKNYSDGIWERADTILISPYNEDDNNEVDTEKREAYENFIDKHPFMAEYIEDDTKNLHLSRCHFRSNVTDVHQFPIMVKETKNPFLKAMKFRLTNIEFYPSVVTVAFHINDTIYPIHTKTLYISLQKADSFYVSMKFNNKNKQSVPLPEQKEIRTITYYPKQDKNDFTISLYQWNLIDRYRMNHPFRVIEYFYYTAQEFDGYLIKDEYLSNKEETILYINPNHSLWFGKNKSKQKQYRPLRRRRNVLSEK